MRGIRVSLGFFVFLLLPLLVTVSMPARALQQSSAPPKKSATPAQSSQKAPVPTELTIDQVIQLVQAGVSEDIIAAKIRKNNKAFDLTAVQIIQLKNAKVGDNIVHLLMDPQYQPPVVQTPPPPPPIQPTAVSEKTEQPKAAPKTEQTKVTEIPKPSRTPIVPANEEEFNRLLKGRYEGKIVVPARDGLIAGEDKKSMFKGTTGLVYYHYHSSFPVPDRQKGNPLELRGKKTAEMDALDKQTFADLKSGLNTTRLFKGESLKVSKLYISGEYLEFDLDVVGLGHLKDLDMNKASRETETTVSGTQVNQTVTVNNFGLMFRFYFDKNRVMKANDYEMVVGEINRYLLPKDEAEQILSAENNIEISPGMSEEEVVSKLGKPLKTIGFGLQKTLQYKELTVVLKDGKVVDVSAK